MPVAVVSNTRSGQAHRDVLDDLGVTGAFAIQIYSDELGVYKPHPSMIWAATRELGVEPGECWFVGDQIGRDIVCARRAGVGAAVLMPPGPPRPPAPRLGIRPAVVEPGAAKPVEVKPPAARPVEVGPGETTPDVVVADGHELLNLLRQRW